MRFLQLCNRVPFPPYDGGTIAMEAVSKGLTQEGVQVDVFSLNTKKHFVQPESASKFQKDNLKIYSSNIDTSVQVLPAFFNLWNDRSYNVDRFYSMEVENALIALLKKNRYDLIQFESIFLVPYLEAVRKHSSAKCVLRAHNVEHTIWERLAASASFPKNIYLNFLSSRLKSYEVKGFNLFDALLPITEHDAKIFKQLGAGIPMHVLPLGIKVEEYQSSKENVEISLFHFGAMDWEPNLEAIRWFLDFVWEEVQLKHPSLKLYLAGRNMPDWLKEKKMKNVFLKENILEPKEFLSSSSVMIVPLLSGSGMRVKIIEGLAAGKAIISTSIGAEGIKIEHQKNILIANTPMEFALCITKCVEDKDVIKNLGTQARLLAEMEYDLKKISKNLLNFYTALN